MESYYEMLGVEPNATQEQIEKAFKELSVKYHPDRCKDPVAKAIYKRVVEAYNLLSDPVKRKEYDTAGSKSAEQQAQAKKPSPLKRMAMDILGDFVIPSVQDYINKNRG